MCFSLVYFVLVCLIFYLSFTYHHIYKVIALEPFSYSCSSPLFFIPLVLKFCHLIFSNCGATTGQQGNRENSESECSCWSNATEELDRIPCCKIILLHVLVYPFVILGTYSFLLFWKGKNWKQQRCNNFEWVGSLSTFILANCPTQWRRHSWGLCRSSESGSRESDSSVCLGAKSDIGLQTYLLFIIICEEIIVSLCSLH